MPVRKITKDPIDYCEHATDILEKAVNLGRSGQRFALVVTLDIQGGSPRDIGSMAVVTETGSMTGYLSNGCIDQDIILQGIDALASSKVKYVRYGAGSQFKDLTLPCGGSMDLVVDPNPDLDALNSVHSTLKSRASARLSFSKTTGVIGDAEHCAGSTNFITVEYAPVPALVLGGRGAILRATAKQASQLDFEVHVVTPDENDLAAISRLTPVSMSHLRSPDRNSMPPIDAHTAVMLLFHEHEWETELLLAAARSPAFYVGALGSLKTQALRLEKLRALGVTDTECSKIHGPVGLVPSLRNASLIAISAISEVISALPQSQKIVVFEKKYGDQS